LHFVTPVLSLLAGSWVIVGRYRGLAVLPSRAGLLRFALISRLVLAPLVADDTLSGLFLGLALLISCATLIDLCRVAHFRSSAVAARAHAFA
jgi:hypothetical protein